MTQSRISFHFDQFATASGMYFPTSGFIGRVFVLDEYCHKDVDDFYNDILLFFRWVKTSSVPRDISWRHLVLAALLPLIPLVSRTSFVEDSVVGTSVRMESLLESDQPVGPGATVVVGPGGHDIRLSGELTDGVAKRLETLLDAHRDILRIHLTSEGGLADEGRAIGDVIAAHKLTTFVPDYCVSACTLAFVRGKDRLILPDARLGFHAPYENGLFGAMYKSDASDEQAAYLAAGLSASFVKTALSVDPANIWYPPVDQLRTAGVVTAAIDRYTLPDSILDDAPTLEGARTTILQNFPILEGFRRHAPDTIGAIAAWYLDAYRQARPEGENVDRLQTIIADAITLSMAEANDATLHDLVRYLDRALATTEDASTCATIGGEWDLLSAQRQLGEGRTATALLARAIAVPPAHSVPGSVSPAPLIPEAPASCAGWRRIYADMLHQTGRQGAAVARARLGAVSVRDRASLRALSLCANGPSTRTGNEPVDGRASRCASTALIAQAITP